MIHPPGEAGTRTTELETEIAACSWLAPKIQQPGENFAANDVPQRLKPRLICPTGMARLKPRPFKTFPNPVLQGGGFQRRRKGTQNQPWLYTVLQDSDFLLPQSAFACCVSAGLRSEFG